MNGFIKKAVRGLALCAGVGALGGCVLYRQVVDPCWPERYNHQARMSVRDTFNAQAGLGHVKDQTIWAWHFEKDARTGEDVILKDPKGKDEKVVLTAGAKEHLKYLAFRRPVPDTTIMLQRDPNGEVNFRRKLAIENYLATIAPGRPFMIEEYDVRDEQAVILPPRFTDDKGRPDPKSAELVLPKLITGQASGSGSGSSGSP